MFKNKHIDGKCNRCGEQIAKLRKQLPDKTSQRILADRMQEKELTWIRTRFNELSMETALLQILN